MELPDSRIRGRPKARNLGTGGGRERRTGEEDGGAENARKQKEGSIKV